MRKRPKVRYVDMAIYIDENVNKPWADTEKIYEYLVMLSYMLAVKRRFFTREDYYDDFAHYFATIVYNRLTDKRQFEDPSSANYITPIKSCLNYMKNIIYGRKCLFCEEEFSQVTEVSTETLDMVREDTIQAILYNNQSIVDCAFDSCVNHLIELIHKHINNGPYGNNKSLSWKLYTSVLLSLLRNFTLSNKNRNKLINFRRINKFNEKQGDCRLNLKMNFESLIEKMMAEETRSCVIVYDLDKEYKEYIYYVVQRVKTDFIQDIKELNQEYCVPDDLVQDVMMASLAEVYWERRDDEED